MLRRKFVEKHDASGAKRRILILFEKGIDQHFFEKTNFESHKDIILE